MTTVRDVITTALRDIDAIDLADAPEADEYAEAETILTRLFYSWAADGMTITQSDGTTAVTLPLDLNDDFPLADKHIEGVTAILAVRLARAYGAQVDPDLYRRSKRARQRLYADFATTQVLEQERPIYTLSHARGRGVPLSS